MKKVAKGAVALGVGTVLLLGGAGTFAYWNHSVNAGAGTVTAGNLELTKVGAGVWKDKAGNIIDISTYRIVPGEDLFLEQKLDVKLEGNQVVAYLSISAGSDASTFTSNFVYGSNFKDAEGTPVYNPLTTSYQGLVATTLFRFWDSTKDRTDVEARFDADKLVYRLVQVPQF